MALEALRRLLNVDYNDRYTPLEALKLPFFADYSEDLAELRADFDGCKTLDFVEAAPTAEGLGVQAREMISALHHTRAALRVEAGGAPAAV